MKEKLYQLLDLITLGRGIKRIISGYELRLPTRYYKYFDVNYEKENINFLSQIIKPGMKVIDVGAHIGLYTCIIAKEVGKSGKIFALEPTPNTFEVLQKTIAINHISNIVQPINMAVSDQVGKATFYITETPVNNSNSLTKNQTARNNEYGIEVDVSTIDRLIIENNIQKIDLLKIDVEGAEYAVLKGSKKTLEEQKPTIILALHPKAIENYGDSLSEIWDFLIKNNYKVTDDKIELTKDYFIQQKDLFDVFLIPDLKTEA